jgi:hypothetical protein
VISDRKELSKAKVTAEVLGESSGPKIDIFKYKSKTGYRRRSGHRQVYSQLRIKKIAKPKAATAKTAEATSEPTKPAASKPPAKKPAAKKPAVKKPAATKPAAATKEPAADKDDNEGA